jgi:hypothetical protein
VCFAGRLFDVLHLKVDVAGRKYLVEKSGMNSSEHGSTGVRGEKGKMENREIASEKDARGDC